MFLGWNPVAGRSFRYTSGQDSDASNMLLIDPLLSFKDVFSSGAHSQGHMVCSLQPRRPSSEPVAFPLESGQHRVDEC